MTVADYLSVAREAHQRYRDSVPRRVPEGQSTRIEAGDPAAARAALRQAYEARTAAEALDPAGVDPAWADDPHREHHYALLVFYRQQLEGA